MHALNSAPSPPGRAPNLDSGKQFVFRTGALWFSVPAIAVREVTIAPALVSVPGCHASLAGLCHFRSEFIPVLALERLLDMDGIHPSEPQDRLIILGDRVRWAIPVAEAAALESLETLVTPELRHEDGNPGLIMGTSIFRGQIVRVLDEKAVLRLAQKSLEETWHRPAAPLEHQGNTL
ncbi:MAG: chemotaxis protein CheW [Rubripirellula sp.]|nr:chemotaxis protein CheW [Rubripirellula sp.]